MYNFSRLFTKTEYTVAYRFNENGLLHDTDAPFTVLPLSDSEYWYADPFICFYNNEYYVFMEVFMKSKGYAGIGCSKIEGEKLTQPEIVIDTGYHMSFPAIYNIDGKLIMIPETCAVNKIQIFECVDFPAKWEAKECIVSGDSYYDSVIFESRQELYMFTSVPSNELYGSHLKLMKLVKKGDSFEVNDETEITDDSNIARQAGLNLSENGSIFRVAQNCSNKDYGHALEFMKIDQVNLNDYKEILFKEIKVSDIKTENYIRGISGIHTYNREGRLEVIDFKLCTFSFESTVLKFRIILDMILERIKRK